jgi:hypothetical protein
VRQVAAGEVAHVGITMKAPGSSRIASFSRMGQDPRSSPPPTLRSYRVRDALRRKTRSFACVQQLAAFEIE